MFTLISKNPLFKFTFVKGAQYFTSKNYLKDEDIAVVIMETALLFYTNPNDDEIKMEKGEIVKIIIENSKMIDGLTIEQPQDKHKVCLISERLIENMHHFITFLLLNLYSVLSMLILSQEDIVNIMDKNLEFNKVSKSNYFQYIQNKTKSKQLIGNLTKKK